MTDQKIYERLPGGTINPAWSDAHLGRLSAGGIYRVMGADGPRATYLLEKLTERVTRALTGSGLSKAMEDGIARQPEAGAAYEEETGEKLVLGHLVEGYGYVATPDYFVATGGLVEVKCPIAKTALDERFGHLLREPRTRRLISAAEFAAIPEKLSPARARVLAVLDAGVAVPATELATEADVSPGVISALIRAGLANEFEEPVEPDVGAIPDDYKWQCIAQMVAADEPWCDLFYYVPDLAPVGMRGWSRRIWLETEDERRLLDCVSEANERLDMAYQTILAEQAEGVLRKTLPMIRDAATHEDVDAALYSVGGLRLPDDVAAVLDEAARVRTLELPAGIEG